MPPTPPSDSPTGPGTGVRILPADAFDATQLAALFTAGFAGYPVPMVLDAAALRDHVAVNDIDLALSRVAVAEQPAALCLLARRGAEAWVGGMGTVPAHRRSGLGERALLAALQAAAAVGVRTVWLEVIETNRPALALYEKLGFTVIRPLTVWARDGRPPVLVGLPGGLAAQRSELDAALAWIAAHRTDREPWQRADAAIVAMRAGQRAPVAWAVTRGKETVAAVIARPAPPAASVLALAAAPGERHGAAVALQACAEGGGLRFSNLPAGSPLADALEQVGARPQITQLEMRYTPGAGAGA